MTLRDRREALGLTQAEVAQRIGASQPTYGAIESGRTAMPSPELRRAISRVLGIRHVDFLVETGQLADWELPGFNANAPEPDPRLLDLMALLGQLDLDADNRATTLSGILRMWAEQDRQRQHERPVAVHGVARR
jgi:transcriptional regulator with XRE-family HTH domain